MLIYIAKRLLVALPTLLIVAVLVFLFVHLLPGDPARLAAGPDADEATVQTVRQELGLDRPLPEQFVHFFSRIVKGDLGTSMRSRRPVATEIEIAWGGACPTPCDNLNLHRKLHHERGR